VRQTKTYGDYGKFCRYKWHFASHDLRKLEDLDYLKNYIKYLPEILGLELENSIKQQLEAQKHLEEIL